MSKNIVLTVVGIVLLVYGIVHVLRHWADVVAVYNGLVGEGLAVIGLFILFLISGKSSKS